MTRFEYALIGLALVLAFPCVCALVDRAIPEHFKSKGGNE